MHFLLLRFGMKLKELLLRMFFLFIIIIDTNNNIFHSLPPGKGHASLQTSQLPGLFKRIFRNEVLNG